MVEFISKVFTSLSAQKLKLFNHNFFWLLLILITAFLVRYYNISFPYFTSDEARIASRGYSLSKFGTDELGRKFPLIFNSVDDYHLPVTSYMSMVGIALLGKNDQGARIVFIFLSVLISIFVYKISDIFHSNREFKLLATLVTAFSSGLIFFSKIPNEFIVLTFSYTLLFYLLTRKKVNFIGIILSILLSLGTSKISWFTIVPFVILTLNFFQPYLPRKIKVMILTASGILTLFVIFSFLQIPQSQRSLMENDFLIFHKDSITVAISHLRGQGLIAGWPSFLEKLLFNKFHYVNVALLHWLSSLNPTILFGQFDKTGIEGFANLGVFSKIMLIPFIIGLIFLIRSKESKYRVLIVYFLVLTYPVIFTFPLFHPSIILTIVPFLSFVIALGLINLNGNLRYSIILIAIAEVLLNLFYISPELKVANSSRPIWIKPLMTEAYSLSMGDKVAISDNIISEVTPYFQWYTPAEIRDEYKTIDFPYKFRQSKLANVKIIGEDETFYKCSQDAPTYVIASKRDLDEIKRFLNLTDSQIIQRVYKDDLENEKAFQLKPEICVH